MFSNANFSTFICIYKYLTWNVVFKFQLNDHNYLADINVREESSWLRFHWDPFLGHFYLYSMSLLLLILSITGSFSISVLMTNNFIFLCAQMSTVHYNHWQQNLFNLMQKKNVIVFCLNKMAGWDQDSIQLKCPFFITVGPAWV